MLECYNCGMSYEPTATHWMCPWCKFKDTCCEGAPQDAAFGGQTKPSDGPTFQSPVEFFWDAEWERTHPPKVVKMVPHEGDV